MTKSKRFTGVYFNELADGDKTYYITYKDRNTGQKQRVKVGKHSEGIREPYCHQKRNEIVNSQRLGEEPPSLIRNRTKRDELDKLAQAYFQEKLSRSKSQNAHKQLSLYNKHLKDDPRLKFIDAIDRATLNELVAEKLESLAEKTVNNIVVLLKAILNWGVAEEKLKANPVASFKKLQVDNDRERYLEIEEIQQLLGEVKDDSRLYLFVLIALSTGGRLQTVLNIQVKDINFAQRTASLINFKRGGTRYTGFLSREICDIIKDMELPKSAYVIGGGEKSLADTTIAKPLRKIFDHLFNEGLEKSDAKNRVVTHTLRHTFASQLASKGTPIFTIQKLMDHANISSTIKYAKLAPDNGKDEVEGFVKNFMFHGIA